VYGKHGNCPALADKDSSNVPVHVRVALECRKGADFGMKEGSLISANMSLGGQQGKRKIVKCH
jgi:hypothetical protein